MMSQPLPAQLEELAKLRHETPLAVLTEALELGLAKLYQDSVLEHYLAKRLSRRKAIRLLGHELVQLAEKQDQAVQEDVLWGLNA